VRPEPTENRFWKPLAEAKNSVPSSSYTLLPSASCRVRTAIWLACCQANTSAEITTPSTTATARSVKMVTTVTATITSASARGTLPSTRTLPHSKVLAETTNITPISAASAAATATDWRNARGWAGQPAGRAP